MPSRPRQFSVLPVRFRVVRMESPISVSHIVMGADIIERDIVGELKRSAVEYPAAWHAEREAVLGGISVPGAVDGQHQAMQGGKRVLDSGAHHDLTEQAIRLQASMAKPSAASVAQKSRMLNASRPKSAFSSLIRFSQSARPRQVRHTSTLGRSRLVTKAPWRQPWMSGSSANSDSVLPGRSQKLATLRASLGQSGLISTRTRSRSRGAPPRQPQPRASAAADELIL